MDLRKRLQWDEYCQNCQAEINPEFKQRRTECNSDYGKSWEREFIKGLLENSGRCPYWNEKDEPIQFLAFSASSHSSEESDDHISQEALSYQGLQKVEGARGILVPFDDHNFRSREAFSDIKSITPILKPGTSLLLARTSH